MSVFEITKAATFDAAHHFPSEPEGSPYRRIHGHSFQVEATVRGEALDAEHGWVADLGALDRALKAAAGELGSRQCSMNTPASFCRRWKTCACGSLTG